MIDRLLDLTRPCNKNSFTLSLGLQTNVLYKLPCADCSWSYIGETGKCFSTRKKEHIRNVKICKTGSNIAAHAWRNNHSIDFNNARVIGKGNFRIRKTLESWLIAYTNEADNNYITPCLCQNNTLLF